MALPNTLQRGPDASANPLRAYFDQVTTGPGVWKWLHYFDIYHRHLAKFVDREVTVIEIGVYSGGSLSMWKHYFGRQCRIHGIDIEPACKVYEDKQITVHLGDQADRQFWKRFRDQVPAVDVLIDDGGHAPDQQRVTLEEILPHLRPGGVYICEDIHGIHNPFSQYAHGLADGLNAFHAAQGQKDMTTVPTPFQAAIHSVHFYPYVLVVEKNPTPAQFFVAPKHGSQWQPFL